jgi:uncharacterized membrane protein
MFYLSVFDLLSFFFRPLCCRFFFDIRIVITPMVSSNSSEDFDIGFWNCFDSVVFSFFPIFIEVGEDNWNVCKTKADWASLAHRWHYTILAIMFKHFRLLASQKLLNDFGFQSVDIERTWWNFGSASCALNSTIIPYPSNGAFEQ